MLDLQVLRPAAATIVIEFDTELIEKGTYYAGSSLGTRLV
jgi:hypothetical protein